MNIIIPQKLSNLIQGITDEVSASIGSSISSVAPILLRNEAPFFPDYTDHGIQHINNVLQTCELIINEDAWNIFTREDTAVLILAAIAHDLGMLVSTETFKILVAPSNTKTVDPNDILWFKLWHEFRLATRRFDGATLSNILGSPEPVNLDELNPDNFTERGRKLAGEFLRRHHHRLSHEILVLGLPSEQGLVQLFDNVPQHFKDLAGIIARSHGVSIRKSIESVVSIDRTAFREYRHIHPTFLMTLVRLADYLDLDYSRAPSSILAAKSLKSPISRREWWAHKAIVDCHSNTDDPECLHVVVEPSAIPNISTYLTIEEKIDGIQQELDNCWAVLGEVYGRFPPLNRISLKIRRIKSDIRHKTVIKQLPFIPHKASLESSKSDLLKLLITPLYGDNPGIGIRELLQNSIDAVRELSYLIQNNLVSLANIDESSEGDIVIKIEQNDDGHPWIIVSDKGIGMTWETICNYYLTAGASFRKSDAWKQKFTSETGDSQVLRSGRFGIGILAAFLLGDIVQVSTRYIDVPEDKGIFFQFGLDDTTIEMKWINRKPGTTIRVKTNRNVIESLKKQSSYQSEYNDKWDWFCLKEPKVLRYDDTGKLINQKYKLPQAKKDIPLGTHKVHVAGYEEIHWTFKKDVPQLVCNGILIAGNSDNRRSGYISLYEEFQKNKGYKHGELYFENPNTSVFDPNGYLPLNLARDGLATQPHNVVKTVTDDICKNFIAFCLLHGPKSRLLSDQQFTTYKIPDYPGYSSYNYDVISTFFFSTYDGFGLVDTWNISFYTKEEPLLIIRGYEQRKFISGTVSSCAAENYKLLYGSLGKNTLGYFDIWHRQLADFDNGYDKLLIFKQCQVRGVRCSMPKKWYKRFIYKQPKYITSSLNIESETNDWIIWTLGECLGSCSNLSTLTAKITQNNLSFESLTECYLSPVPKNTDYGRIAKIWKETIGEPIIPFDMQKRKKIINRLDESFTRHLEEWRKVSTK